MRNEETQTSVLEGLLTRLRHARREFERLIDQPGPERDTAERRLNRFADELTRLQERPGAVPALMAPIAPGPLGRVERRAARVDGGDVRRSSSE
jgi:hypothetical protein